MVNEASRLSVTSPTPRRRHSIVTKIVASLVSAAAVLSLTGCSTGTPSSSDAANADASSSSAGFPITMKSPVGNAVIESKPERVSTVGWTNQDAVLALGVVPVDMPTITYGDTDGDGLLSWTKEALTKLGATGDKAPSLHDETDDIDAEAIAATEPDIILGIQSGITEKQYATLSKIAPTVAYPSIAWAAPWREVVTDSAKALGLQEKGKRVIADNEKAIATELAKYPQLKDKTASVMYFDTAKMSSISVYTTTDAREKYLNDLGFTTPDSVKKLSEGNTEFYQTVSSEHADDFDDVDIIVTYGDSTTLAALQADPLMSKIPAVKRGSVVVIDNSSSLSAAVSPSALSIPATVAEYTKMLAAAADAVK